MSITCKDLLRLAQRLAGSHLEVDLRDAGSRAYFAAYHACHQLGEHLGLLAPQVREQEGHHKRLIRAMQMAKISGLDQDDPAVRRLGQALRSLRDQRNAAEYRLGKSFVRSQAKQMIFTSERILSEVERILWERRGREGANTIDPVFPAPDSSPADPEQIFPDQTPDPLEQVIPDQAPPVPEQVIPDQAPVALEQVISEQTPIAPEQVFSDPVPATLDSDLSVALPGPVNDPVAATPLDNKGDVIEKTQ
ncbi:MAG: hypothetical protein HQL64_10160 [Magnetococcales bacterium]|nr:hypothetical protein [Magnetococcales bacterium]